MDYVSYMTLIFPIAITLHNIEEALWLPEWSKQGHRLQKPVEKHEFYFAVLCITALAYLISFTYGFYRDIDIIRYLFFGFVGAMVINAVIPHLAATIIMKRYAPGVVTGVMLNLPCFSFIIYHALNKGLIETDKLIMASIGVGLTLLMMIPELFKIANRIVK